MSGTTNSSSVSLHLKKHKANNVSVNGLQRHNEREVGSKHKNKNINDERTADNIFLKKADMSFYKTVQAVISKNRDGGLTGIRKDAVRMVEATVQLSGLISEQSEETQEAVLRDSYEWLKETFGEENIVSATIHKDETSMHLHFDFVPITEKVLSAKKVVGREELQQYQDDFLQRLQTNFDNMNFQRKSGEYNGLSQKVFEKLQEERKQMEQEVRQARNKVNEDAKKLKFAHSKLIERETALDARETVLDDREIALKGKEGQIHEREQKWLKTQNTASEKLKEREDKVSVRETDMNDRILNYNKAVEKLKAERGSLNVRETDLNTREIDLDARETVLTDKEIQIHERDKKSLKTQNMALQTMRDAKHEKELAEHAKQEAERSKKDADDGSRVLAIASERMEQLLEQGVNVTTSNIKDIQEWNKKAAEPKKTPYEAIKAVQDFEKLQQKPTKEQDDFLSAVDGLTAMTDKDSMSL